MEDYPVNVKCTVAFYIISIIMLVNGSLFGWMFAGTPLLIWRQGLWIIGLWIVYKFLPCLGSHQLDNIFQVEKRFLLIIVCLSIVTVIVYNFNLVRIAFAFWIYFSGLPFVIFPYLVKQSKIMSAKTFYTTFTVFGLFLTIGLITDYLTEGFFTKKFLVSTADNKALIEILRSGRFCFLSEAPTIVGVFYSFCMLCGILRMYYSGKFVTKLIYLIISGSFIVGGWFTGSRQIVAVLAIMYICGVVFYFFMAKDSKNHIIFTIIAALIFVPSFYSSFLLRDSSYSERYSTKSISEDTRSRAWAKGFHDTVIDDVLITIFGKAVALSQGQKAQVGEIIGPHYENTYFGRLSECGLAGLLLLCYPVIYILRHLGRWSLFQIMMILIIVTYLLTCFVSPNGQHQTSQMAIFLAMGLFVARDYFDPDYDDTII